MQCNEIIFPTTHRDADKGDEPKPKAKTAIGGRNKRPAEEAGARGVEDGNDVEEIAEQGSKYSKAAAKRAKVEHASEHAT